MKYERQVEKSHYSFENYFYPGRWMSYWYQVKEITGRRDIASVLDIGAGTTFMKDVIKIHRSDILYKTLDVATDLEPDYVGPVDKIPLGDNTFDLVCAFQVLEHIKFDDFEKSLKEMGRVSKKYVFISLPHFGTPVKFLIRIPFLPEIKFSFKIPRPKKHTFCGQHYWEIGKKGYSPKVIREIISKEFTILNEYSPFENPYHRFFILHHKKYDD